VVAIVRGWKLEHRRHWRSQVQLGNEEKILNGGAMPLDLLQERVKRPI
jgi:hypothetical protein